MVVEFVIARNPDESSSLPFLTRLPLGLNCVALKVRETWPRTSKVYCHRADEWPDDLEVIERIPVRSHQPRPHPAQDQRCLHHTSRVGRPNTGRSTSTTSRTP